MIDNHDDKVKKLFVSNACFERTECVRQPLPA